MMKSSTLAFCTVAWLTTGTAALAQEAPPPPAPPGPEAAPPGAPPAPPVVRPGWRREVNWSIREFSNTQGNGMGFTQLGLSMKGIRPSGWYGGIACFKGLNIGDQVNVDGESHAGLMGGKLWEMGPMMLGVGALVGMGYTVTVTPTLGFSNFGVYLVGEPEVSLGWSINPNLSLSLALSYEATTRPSQVGGPAVTLTLSHIRWGRPRRGW